MGCACTASCLCVCYSNICSTSCIVTESKHLATSSFSRLEAYFRVAAIFTHQGGGGCKTRNAEYGITEYGITCD